MNICMITTTLPPVTGGLETHVWELSRKLVKQGHSVTVIGSRNYQGRVFPDFEEKEGVRIYRVRDTILPVYYFRYRLFALRAAALAYKLNLRRPFDLVHIHQIYPAGTAGALLKTFLKIPLVITVHGSAFVVNWEVTWIRPLIKWALRNANPIIAVGRELEKKLIGCGVTPDRIELLPNTVDTVRFSPEKKGEEVRKRFDWSVNDVVIGYAGRLTRPKGAHLFIEMARKLIKNDTNLKFLLIGSGELEKELRHRLHLSGHEKNFAVTGGVDYEVIPDYLGAIDILVVPSFWEPGGRSCLEGMAMGRAVVANRVGGMADLIVDGKTGILINTNSPRSRCDDPVPPEYYIASLAGAVEKLAKNPARRKLLGENARRDALMHHSLQAGIEKISALYERVGKKD